MTEVEVIAVARDAVWTLLRVGAPVMGVALVTGLIIALFQALTQIQEVTLTFVPKIIAIFLSFLLLAPYMLAQLDGLMIRVADRIVGG